MCFELYGRWLANIEKKLAASKGVYFYDKMSVADILIANRVKKLIDGHFVGVPTTIVDHYPNVFKLHDSVVGQPKIPAFIAKHAE